MDYVTPWGHVWLSARLPGSSVHGKKIRVGGYFLLQGIFPAQRLNLVSYVSCIGSQFLYQRYLGRPFHTPGPDNHHFTLLFLSI